MNMQAQLGDAKDVSVSDKEMNAFHHPKALELPYEAESKGTLENWC